VSLALALTRGLILIAMLLPPSEIGVGEQSRAAESTQLEHFRHSSERCLKAISNAQAPDYFDYASTELVRSSGPRIPRNDNRESGRKCCPLREQNSPRAANQSSRLMPAIRSRKVPPRQGHPPYYATAPPVEIPWADPSVLPDKTSAIVAPVMSADRFGK
jgi:hypothetical protein